MIALAILATAALGYGALRAIAAALGTQQIDIDQGKGTP